MEVRCHTVKILLAARKNPPKVQRMKALKGIRKFSIPTLEWNAKTWCDIIDWKSVKVYEPAILAKLDTDQLNLTKLEPLVFPDFPAHSQSVERGVKLVTEAATKVAGELRRHQHILSVIQARNIRKQCDTKSGYVYETTE